MVLPDGQEGALSKATRGLAVFTTTGLPAVTSPFTTNVTVVEALSPDTKSLATTWILKEPWIPVGTHTKGLLVHVALLSVPGKKSFAMVSWPPGGVTLNWNARGPVLVSVPVAVQVMLSPIRCGLAGDEVREAIVTVAKAGANNTVSKQLRNKSVLLNIFIMQSFPVEKRPSANAVSTSLEKYSNSCQAFGSRLVPLDRFSNLFAWFGQQLHAGYEQLV
jgi:hypothetical protein